VTGIAGTAWKEAVRRLDLPFLRIVVTGSPDAQDLYCEWHRPIWGAFREEWHTARLVKGRRQIHNTDLRPDNERTA
jgi:hypothetical protein